jgi:hypothetical protein
VHVYVDDVLAASQDVDTSNGPDSFDMTVNVAEGTHELRVDWEDDGEVIATRSVTVTHEPGPVPGGGRTDANGHRIAPVSGRHHSA